MEFAVWLRKLNQGFCINLVGWDGEGDRREFQKGGAIVISSVQFSCSVVSDSVQPHESQHARPPCPSPTPEVHQTHVHSVSDAIQPSHLLSSPSPPAFNLSQHQGLFK